MATGILSIAAEDQGQALLSRILLAAAAVVFAVLAALAFRHRSHPLKPPAVVVDLLTWVAACGVLGEGLSPTGWPLEIVLWAAGLAAWLAASVVLLRQLLTRARGGSANRVEGRWLLLVVAPQSLAVLGSSSLWTVSLVFSALGLVLYALVITLLVRRLLSGDVGLAGFTPDYWITMGALAISSLATTHLALAAKPAPVLVAMAWICWALASAWIPYLATVEVTRDVTQRRVLNYTPSRWSMVFPLGMYGVATHELATTAGVPTLYPIAGVFFVLGLAAWLLTAAAWARQFRA